MVIQGFASLAKVVVLVSELLLKGGDPVFFVFGEFLNKMLEMYQRTKEKKRLLSFTSFIRIESHAL